MLREGCRHQKEKDQQITQPKIGEISDEQKDDGHQWDKGNEKEKEIIGQSFDEAVLGIPWIEKTRQLAKSGATEPTVVVTSCAPQFGEKKDNKQYVKYVEKHKSASKSHQDKNTHTDNGKIEGFPQKGYVKGVIFPNFSLQQKFNAFPSSPLYGIGAFT